MIQSLKKKIFMKIPDFLKNPNINPKSFRDFYNEMKFNTRMRDSFCEAFEKHNSIELNNKWKGWDMEVCWWACGNVFMLENWINEDDYILKKINFDTNRTPDYIVENIHTKKTIGIEVTSIQMPLKLHVVQNENKYNSILKIFNKRINENKNFIDRAIEAYTKKSKNNFINWEKVDKKALVITFDTLKDKDSLYLKQILIELINKNKIEKKFDYFLISSGDLLRNIIFFKN